MVMMELMIADSVGPTKPQEDAGLESISSGEVQQHITWTIDLMTSPEPEAQPEFTTMDSEPTEVLVMLCTGYTLPFLNGKSPHTSYSFALHDTQALPWDYALRNGVMTVFV